MDEQLLLWINHQWAHPALDFVFSGLSSATGFGIPLLVLLSLYVGLRFGANGWKTAVLLILITALSDQLANLLKDGLQQARPCLELFDQIRRLDVEDARCLTSTDGMPSSHAMNFFASMTFLALRMKSFPWTLGLIGIALMVSLSRIYLGVHYPIQATTGAIAGLLLGTALAWLSNRYLPPLKREEK